MGCPDYQSSRAGYPSRPADLRMVLEHEDARTNALVDNPGGLRVVREDAEVDLAKVSACQRRPLGLQVGPP